LDSNLKHGNHYTHTNQYSNLNQLNNAVASNKFFKELHKLVNSNHNSTFYSNLTREEPIDLNNKSSSANNVNILGPNSMENIKHVNSADSNMQTHSYYQTNQSNGNRRLVSIKPMSLPLFNNSTTSAINNNNSSNSPTNNGSANGLINNGMYSNPNNANAQSNGQTSNQFAQLQLRIDELERCKTNLNSLTEATVSQNKKIMQLNQQLIRNPSSINFLNTNDNVSHHEMLPYANDDLELIKLSKKTNNSRISRESNNNSVYDYAEEPETLAGNPNNGNNGVANNVQRKMNAKYYGYTTDSSGHRNSNNINFLNAKILKVR
jgi:hypothetical protein